MEEPQQVFSNFLPSDAQRELHGFLLEQRTQARAGLPFALAAVKDSPVSVLPSDDQVAQQVLREPHWAANMELVDQITQILVLTWDLSQSPQLPSSEHMFWGIEAM